MKLRSLIKTRLGQKIAGNLIRFYLLFVYKTSHLEYRDRHIIDDALKSNTPLIFCFWHRRLALMPFSWKWDPVFYMLLSNHGDGQLIGYVLKSLGPFETVNGSTDRGGTEAARHIVSLLKKKIPIGITPDGPKGPSCQSSPGTTTLAYLSQATIIPVSYQINRYKTLRTWDRFCLPLPFSRGVFRVHTPLAPPQNRDDFKNHQRFLEEALNALEVPLSLEETKPHAP